MKIDYGKRRLVMERSQALGHCICDPRRPCPCDVFRDHGICPCAGERPAPMNLAEVRLTQLVRNAGCASKIAPADLESVLQSLPPVVDPAVISGLAAADDAAIYRIRDDLCLVQTVDVFTPCVDDPHLFGRICAANCLSDIYAMGGEPRTALSILAFPSETLDGEIMFRMLSGGMETLAEAGVALVGGHSIKDDEIKLGFAVTGTIDPMVAAALERPNPGDVLVLTKPLGTGVLAFCRQIGSEFPEGFAQAEASMAALNRSAAEAMREADASACTDITGFGLFGHLMRLARQSSLGAVIYAGELPAFDGAVSALRGGIIPGAIERNREFVGSDLKVAGEVDEAIVNLGFDAQTSGGLLIAVPVSSVERLRDALAKRGVSAFVVGEVSAWTPGQSRILLRPRAAEKSWSATASDGTEIRTAAADFNNLEKMNTQPSSSGNSPAHDQNCCTEMFAQKAAAGSPSETQTAFSTFMRATQGAGVLDARTKELLLFGMVVLTRCSGCFDAHYKQSLEMGITRAELDEAAWCAIAMGGAPVRMFYQESLKRVTSGGPAV